MFAACSRSGRFAVVSCASDAIFNICSSRNIATTPCLLKVTSGKHKATKNKSRPLTYEMAIRPPDIGVKKAWLTWHTSNLEGFGHGEAHRIAEDETLRRLIRGIWHNLFVTELVIKRRGNLICVAGIVQQTLSVRKMYWLIGFTEELLSNLFKQPVKMELQSVENREQVVYKYI